MRYLWILLLILSCADPADKTDVKEILIDELVDFFWEFELHEYPMFATQVGVNTFNDQLGSFKEEDFQRRGAVYDSLLQVLDGWNSQDLSPEDRLEYELIRYHLSDLSAEVNFKRYQIPLLADGGFHIAFAFLPSSTPFKKKQDYYNYLQRLNQFPEYVQQHIELMRAGLAGGMTQPQVIFEGYEVTYRTHIVEDITKSQFFKPFLKLQLGLSPSDSLDLLTQATSAVKHVIQGYSNFSAFMEEEYIPRTRISLGASELPEGQAYYQQRIEHFTTLSLTAREIHDIGLQEVARIKGEMQEIIDEVGFEGDLQGFINYLRSDPKFYAREAQELMHYAAYLSKKADAALPKLFGKLPRQPYGVAPVPEHLAPKYTSGRYISADIHSTLPGYYWVNTYNLSSRPMYVLPALTLHEAVPGHHLQSALTQELEGFSAFRKNLYISAFGEGWGLYCEFLGQEMDIYEDPYTNFGRLTYEMWRACRLVVDTGIHAFGWTRDQVRDYMLQHTALSYHEITTETDRYISWPGQALAYKMGELKIKELRELCERQLGEDFDIREFHDLILSQGTVTLPILENMVNEHLKEKTTN